MSKPLLRTGDRSICVFRFMYNPEYISVGSTMLFREGRTKGMGKITKLLKRGTNDIGPTFSRSKPKKDKARMHKEKSESKEKHAVDNTV
jgi:hypothetical protein